MKLTLQTRLLPDEAQAASLKTTVARFNEAANWLAGEAFKRRTANKILLQTIYYPDLRARFGLSAQMAVRCIAQVCEAYKRDRARRPTFRKHAAVPYDQRLMSFKGIDRVSLLTLEGRVIVPVVMGRYQAERYTLAKGQSDLVLPKDGKWFLLVTVDLPGGAPTPATDFIGIDLGVENLATDSDGAHQGGAGVEQTRGRYQTQRQKLQQAGAKRKARGSRPKQIRWKLKNISAHESRFRRHANHCLSKQLVAKAKDTARGIALEDLQGIRERTRFRKPQRAKMGGWHSSSCEHLSSTRPGSRASPSCSLTRAIRPAPARDAGTARRPTAARKQSLSVVSVGIVLMLTTMRLSTSEPGRP